MLEIARRYLPTFQGRIATGAALVSAIVVGLWPDHPRPFDIEKAIAVGAAAAAWLFSELANAGKPSDHDRQLFDRIIEQLPSNLMGLLEDHDFATSFLRARLDGLFEINGWSGSRSEFLDSTLQKRWRNARAKIDAFVILVAQLTIPTNANMSFSTVHPTAGDPENPSAQTLEEIKQLNDTSSELYKSLDSFEKFGRKRMAF